VLPCNRLFGVAKLRTKNEAPRTSDPLTPHHVVLVTLQTGNDALAQVVKDGGFVNTGHGAGVLPRRKDDAQFQNWNPSSKSLSVKVFTVFLVL